MRLNRLVAVVFLLLASVAIGCAGRGSSLAVGLGSSDQFEDYLGSRVSVVGIAVNMKGSAGVQLDGAVIDIPEMHSWPAEIVGETIQVSGEVGVLEISKDSSRTSSGAFVELRQERGEGRYWKLTATEWELVGK